LPEEEIKESIEKQNPSEAGFKKVEKFLKDGEDAIEKTENQVEKEIKEGEEKLEKLEEQKEELDEKEEDVIEQIAEEKANVEELKEEEKSLKQAEKVVENIQEKAKKKKINILEAIAGFKKLFKSEKPDESIDYEEGKRNKFKKIYEDNYKVLLIIPFLLLLLAVGQISYQYSSTGDFVNRGVELKGGITLTIPEKSYNIDELEEFLNTELEGDISVRRLSQTMGLLIEASDVTEEDLLEKVQLQLGELDAEKDYSIEEMGSSLGSSFFSEIIKAIMIAFILMAIVVFITFRVPAPCLAVILAAVSDRRKAWKRGNSCFPYVDRLFS